MSCSGTVAIAIDGANSGGGPPTKHRQAPSGWTNPVDGRAAQGTAAGSPGLLPDARAAEAGHPGAPACTSLLSMPFHRPASPGAEAVPG